MSNFSINFNNLYTVKISELRAFVKQHNIFVGGDKRRKSSFHVAIASFLNYWYKVEEGVVVAPSCDLDEKEMTHDEELAHEIGVAEGLIETDPSTYSQEIRDFLKQLLREADEACDRAIADIEG